MSKPNELVTFYPNLRLYDASYKLLHLGDKSIPLRPRVEGNLQWRICVKPIMDGWEAEAAIDSFITYTTYGQALMWTDHGKVYFLNPLRWAPTVEAVDTSEKFVEIMNKHFRPSASAVLIKGRYNEPFGWRAEMMSYDYRHNEGFNEMAYSIFLCNIARRYARYTNQIVTTAEQSHYPPVFEGPPDLAQEFYENGRVESETHIEGGRDNERQT